MDMLTALKICMNLRDTAELLRENGEFSLMSDVMEIEETVRNDYNEKHEKPLIQNQNLIPVGWSKL